MSVFSYHLIKLPLNSVLGLHLNPPKPQRIPGLIHLELMSMMTLGSPVFSPSRILFRKVVVFAQWENEKALDFFLEKNSFGKKLSKGWHVRLEYLRQWGEIDGFDIPKAEFDYDSNKPVVAVTIARMRLSQLPRFIRWGRPTEKLVRDHPGTLIAHASIRFPRTVSTFSIWKSQKEMTDMVHGRSNVPKPKRHAVAMKERNRKDFHYQFTTLRFKPLAEYGSWNDKTNIISLK